MGPRVLSIVMAGVVVSAGSARVPVEMVVSRFLGRRYAFWEAGDSRG